MPTASRPVVSVSPDILMSTRAHAVGRSDSGLVWQAGQNAMSALPSESPDSENMVLGASAPITERF
eukprot:15454112-Alexandrium_andersonii.AAC.1